jgi:flagellar motor switch protein FliN
MTEAPSAAIEREPSTYVQTWADSFAHVLGQITAIQVPCILFTESPGELPAFGENDLWILCTSTGGLRGEMSLRLPTQTVLRFAQLFMSETPTPEAELTADHREAALEFSRQVAGIVSSAIKPRWGEVQVRIEMAPGAASWPASSTFWMKAGDEHPAAWIELHLSAALVAALRVEQTLADQPGSNISSSPPASASPENTSKLGLLMDVELAMTLRFGSRRLLLREILDLSPGTVIELDRQVQEPIDVLLDGRLVARGEVVVMDGNYGLRITEVVSAGAM